MIVLSLSPSENLPVSTFLNDTPYVMDLEAPVSLKRRISLLKGPIAGVGSGLCAVIAVDSESGRYEPVLLDRAGGSIHVDFSDLADMTRRLRLAFGNWPIARLVNSAVFVRRGEEKVVPSPSQSK
jgi:hypothetical protein